MNSENGITLIVYSIQVDSANLHLILPQRLILPSDAFSTLDSEGGKGLRGAG